ncbi:MAG: hypothetical protein HC828_21135 [Blastochloris sp.]|nr:hypothetical protein [Blastochloris sp.]
MINRVNQVGKPEDLQQLRKFIPLKLARHFQRHDGTFDDNFYHRRVFFVNALGALQARQANGGAPESLPPLNEADPALEATGVPALERALYEFLTEEQRLQAAWRLARERLLHPRLGRAWA